MLKLDPKNTTLLEQKQKLLAESIEETETKLKTLRKASEQAAESVKKYDAWEKAYDPIQKEIEETGDKITKLKAKMSEMKDAGEVDTEEYKNLEKELANSTVKLRELRQEAEKVNKTFDNPISPKQFDALQREIIETEQKLDNLKEKAKKTSTLNANLTAFGDAASSASEKTKGLSTAAGGLLGAMAATVPATSELRSDLSKLDNNARNAGVGIDATRDAFDKFNVVSDETDSSVEATSNLLQAGFTESNLQKAVEGLSGAYLRFPDTLKIESLADSLQETLATGKATGQFGELLDRLGIGADNFSAGLQECTSDAEKQNYALQTLADAGLMDTYNGWEENNKALVENKKANQEFQEAMAGLAEVMTPIITKITEFASKVINAFNNLPGPVQNFVLVLLGIVAALSPVLGIIGKLSTLLGSGGLTAALGSIKAGFAAAGAAISGVAAPILIVIGVVTSLIAIFATLWKTNENFRESVSSAWSQIQAAIQTAISTIQEIFSAFVELVNVIWTQWGDTIMQVVQNTISTVTSVISNGLKIVENLIKLVSSILQGDWKGAWNAAKAIVQSALSLIRSLVTSTFNNIVAVIRGIGSKIGSSVRSAFDSAISFLTSLPSKAVKWGSDFIDGIVRGIKGAIGKVTGAVKDVADKISSFLHFSRPDEGPLHFYEEWMPDMMKGLAKGIYDYIPTIQKAAQAAAETINYEIMKDTPMQTIDYNMLYNSVRRGASDSSTVLYIGERAYKRQLKGMGVVFQG